ncbi:MAG: 2Fe-2S iron-sulfur cluster-binding protein [Flavobacteriaceae bacterium]
MAEFHSLTVSKIRPLSPNAVAVTFDIPASLKANFSFEAGQYITIKHPIEGKELRRAYSISSKPTEEKITVGIKKVKDGKFSLFANTELKEGDTLEVMPPMGRFIFASNRREQRIAAFAAGSGITPIMSIAQTVLEANDTNRFVLVYGNQSPEETMFHEEILELRDKYTDRFFVKFSFSRAQVKDSLFGRIETSTVNYILKNVFSDTNFDSFYLCGPESMINQVTDTLKANGVPEEHILFELFTTTEVEDEVTEDLEGKTSVEVTLDDETFNFDMDKKTLVLDAVLKEDIDAPYSCQGGVCSTCIARVTEGKAEMVKNQILTDSEIEEGFILTCQSHPLTPVLKIDYDDV